VPDAAKGLTTRAQTVAGTCGTLPLRAFGAYPRCPAPTRNGWSPERSGTPPACARPRCVGAAKNPSIF